MKFGILRKASNGLVLSVSSSAYLSLAVATAAFSDSQYNAVDSNSSTTVSSVVPSASRWSLPFSAGLPTGDPKALKPKAQAAPPAAASPPTVTPATAALRPAIGQPAATTYAPAARAPMPAKSAQKPELATTPKTVGNTSYQVLKLDSTKPVAAAAASTQPAAKNVIVGKVSAWDGPVTVDHIVNHLVDASYQRSHEGQVLDKQVKRLAGPAHVAMDATKDALNKSLDYQGFDPSARAGKLIRDDQYKIRNIAWAEYERQKYVDKIHAQVVASMMQIAEGMGMTDGSRSAAVVGSAKGSLEALVGEEEAQRTITVLTVWLNRIKVPESTFKQSPWNTIERNKKLEDVIRTALKQDQVLKEIDKRLQKYAHPGLVKNTSAKVIGTTLSAVSLLGPGFAIPVGAEVVNDSLRVATGGSEQKKLERELLLDKRIQSRYKVLSQEAALALDNYRFALVTHNSPLLSFSEEVLANMTGKDKAAQIVYAKDTAGDAPAIVPEMIESRAQNN